MIIDLKYLSPEPDHYGNERLYVRWYGRRIRIRISRNDPSFLDAYYKALEALAEWTNATTPPYRTPSKKKIAVRGSLGWLASLYFASNEFNLLQSGPTRRAVVKECLRETVRDKSPDLMADRPLSFVTLAKIKRLRDLKNEARVRRVKYSTSGFHTWSVAEVCQFPQRHPIGTQP